MRELGYDEIEDLKALLEETSKIELHLDTDAVKAINSNLKKDVRFYTTSRIRFHPPKNPRSFYINLKIDYFNDNIIETVEKLCKCLPPPFRIFIDFFCISTSSSHPEPLLIHPSVASCFNNITLIRNFNDRNNLLQEFEDDFNQKILENHHLVRRYFL